MFAPHPTPDDYVAVAIYDLRRLAYTKTRDMKWMIIDVNMEKTDRLVDLAYDTDADKVYCVTACGDVHVLHIPRDRRRRPIVEPLQVERTGLPFKLAAIYTTPYDTASKFTGIKKIFFSMEAVPCVAEHHQCRLLAHSGRRSVSHGKR